MLILMLETLFPHIFFLAESFSHGEVKNGWLSMVIGILVLLLPKVYYLGYTIRSIQWRNGGGAFGAEHNKEQEKKKKKRKKEKEKMMVVTDTANQDRRIRHESFLLPPKRIRTGPSRGEEASVSPKEKKDKIGERVSALQHLVSPYGKSDTASVLKEAAAYIKFLQDQLQVLSTPYLRSSPTRKFQEGEKSYSLRNRGLCLMPVNETVLIARSNGADIWAPISK